MKLMMQVAGGILLAGLVALVIVGIGGMKFYSPDAGAVPTPTAVPASQTDREIGALVADCGIDAATVRQQVDRFYDGAPLPAGGLAAGERYVLDGLMPTVDGPRPGFACELLSLGSLDSVKH